MDTVVPLWLGVLLRQRNMGRILPLEWMDVDVLRAVLQHEKDPTKASFSSELPFRYAELARSILAVESDIDQADQIRLLLEDIATVRMDKIRRNLHTLSEQSLSQTATLPIIDVTNIGSLEMAALRPFITQAFRDHLTLSRKTRSASNRTEKNTGAQQARASRLGRPSAKTDIGADEGENDVMDDDIDEVPVTKGRSRIRRFR
mmetsp:Transcript_704/g.853  ORF Transcript_704/g.853 Transcript_704/m.853 type:complete len:203 (+) Transcript_704:2-610(+)